MIKIKKVLVIDDCSVFRERLLSLSSTYVEIGNYTSPVSFSDIKDVSDYDLYIIDIDSTYTFGSDFLSKLQLDNSFHNCSIVYKSSLQEKELLTKAITEGDDFLSPSMSDNEIEIRIHKVLNSKINNHLIISFGPLKVDLRNDHTFINDLKINLTQIETKLLYHFLSKPQELLQVDDLILKTWGSNYFISKNNLNTHFTNIRKKIDASGLTLKSKRDQGIGIFKKSNT